MKNLPYSRDASSKGAALIIVLALVVLLAGIALAYFSRTTTDRQLAQSSYNDTSADLLARSALDITVSDLKQEIAIKPVTTGNIQPSRYGAPPITDPTPIPNLIRRSFSGAPESRASSVSSGAASANGRSISLARWNSHYLIPRASTTNSIDSTPVSSFIAPDWVLVTAQGPTPAPTPSASAVIGRYAFAVYDEGGLIDTNLGGFPTYASLSRPTRPTRRLAAKYPLEESEIMLAVCQPPDINPDLDNQTGSTGSPFSCGPYHANHNPTLFSANFLPHGLFVNPVNGAIFGIPTSPGTFTITVTASNQCGPGHPLTLNLTIDGLPSPDSTPWPVNLARKGTVAFADVTTLPAIPTVITPTTPVGSMGGFPSTIQINKIMGWRNYATTQQPTSASFDSPSFPLVSADNYARYFLGAALPFTTPFTTVSTAVANPPSPGRTDQAVMSRQELIRLQRTIGFSQSLLQYLGTFSREQNRPAPDWPQAVAARWDMNYLALAIPDAWIVHPGHHGGGHAWGLQRHTEFAQRFGLVWVNGNFVLGTRFIDPNYYGHWRYIHTLNPLPANNPDFFQIIDYAMNQANGGVPDPNHVRNTFNVGAALIDQYDTDDLYDPDPNPLANGNAGNTITIIDYGGASYAYGIEGMSFDNPIFNSLRPPFAPYPPPAPAGYVLLNRRFENVGEFGYAYNPASTLASKTLDFASSTSHDRALLDLFTYNSASGRAGIVNLNTRNGPVLASIIRGALLNDPGAENTPTVLVSQQDALSAGQAIVQETTSTTAGRGPALTRGDVARLAAAAAAAVPNLAASDETKQTIARALAEAGQARTWNLMIDVIAQTGRYAPGTASVTDANKFAVEGEKRYWLHIALDRDDGSVLGTQLEEVIE
jgi:Putative Ig domain